MKLGDFESMTAWDKGEGVKKPKMYSVVSEHSSTCSSSDQGIEILWRVLIILLLINCSDYVC